MFKNLSRFLRIYRETKNIDLIDINYYFSQEKFGLFRKFPSLSNKGLFYGISRLIIRLLLNSSLRGLGFYLPPKNRILMFAGTHNQYKVICPIQKGINDSVIVGVAYRKPGIKFHYPSLLGILASLLFIPSLIQKYKLSQGYGRKAIKVGFDCYFSTYGTYLIHRIFLSWNQPKAIVIANDHVFFYRSLLYAAHMEEIPICYVQHATVNENFPALAFDVALLHGMDSWKKYGEKVVGDGNVYLIGDVSFTKDNMTTVSAKKVGISVNKLSTMVEVNSLVEEIKSRKPDLEVVLRTHPGDKRYRLWERLSHKKNIQLSDGRKESSYHFLKTISHLISHNSGIILEAARVGVIPMLWLNEGEVDDYDFINKGVAEKVSSVEDVLSLINSDDKDCYKKNTTWYFSDVGTRFEGLSETLAIKIVAKELLGENALANIMNLDQKSEGTNVYSIIDN